MLAPRSTRNDTLFPYTTLFRCRHEVKLKSGASVKGKTVILSTGARWRQMGVPGEAEYRNKGVAYCPHCDGPLFKGKRVAVIGGGNSGEIGRASCRERVWQYGSS